jgi:hypothetical protein
LGGGAASHAELSDLLRCTWSAQDCRTGHGGGRGSAFYRSVRLE